MDEDDYKEHLLKSFQLVDDEPDLSSNLFGVDIFINNIKKLILKEELPTPYSIVLDGVWGSGKTSVLKRIFNDVSRMEKSKKGKIRSIWFDAWQYEKLNPVSALMTEIIIKYEKSQRAKDLIQKAKGVGLVFADVLLKSTTLTSLGDIKKISDDFLKLQVESIKTIKDDLESMTIKERLIIFIDDLDRCSIDNIMDVLESMKLFLNAKGVIFLMAVDLRKLEIAWKIKHGKNFVLINEGQDHLEKIFQLRLLLPKKSEVDLSTFINNIAPLLEQHQKNFIVSTIQNPRKIKRIINFIYFLIVSNENAISKKLLDLIIIWALLETTFPKIALLSRGDSFHSFSEVFSFVLLFNDYNELIKMFGNIKRISPGTAKNSFGDLAGMLDESSNFTKEILQILENDAFAYQFFYHLKLYLNSSPIHVKIDQILKDNTLSTTNRYQTLKEEIDKKLSSNLLALVENKPDSI